MNDEETRLQQALEQATPGDDPLQQLKALRQSQLAACAVRGGREIARLQRAAAQSAAEGPPAPADSAEKDRSG